MMKIEIAPNPIGAFVLKHYFRCSARQRNCHCEYAATCQGQVRIHYAQVLAREVDVCGKKLPTDSGANAVDWQSHRINEPAADVKNASRRVPVGRPIVPPAIALNGSGAIPFLATAPFSRPAEQWTLYCCRQNYFPRRLG